MTDAAFLHAILRPSDPALYPDASGFRARKWKAGQYRIRRNPGSTAPGSLRYQPARQRCRPDHHNTKFRIGRFQPLYRRGAEKTTRIGQGQDTPARRNTAPGTHPNSDPDANADSKTDGNTHSHSHSHSHSHADSDSETNTRTNTNTGTHTRVDTNTDAEYTWVLDPIDGTLSYISACPLFGTLIALRKGTTCIWGAIHLPALGLLYMGDNAHAWGDDRELKVRETPALKDCTLLFTEFTRPAREKSGPGWDQLVKSVGISRGWGDCYGYTVVANGGADIMTDPIMNLWDIAALLPVIRGAGAAVTDWHGQEPDVGSSLVVSHPRHHARILEMLNPV
ncbi:MAG: inositol monophosphatase family protein [Candidatus Sumerlaeota bacterium]